METTNGTESTKSNWERYYIIGGIAALLAALFFRKNFSAEISIMKNIVAPTTALEWFTLIQDNRLRGLAMLNFFDVVNFMLVGLVFLALYGILKQTNESYAIVATALGLVGIATYFSSNQAFSMLSLSDRYAAATTDAQRSMFLAAGEALLSIESSGMNQSTAVYMSIFLVALAGLIFSITMLQSDIFTKPTAYIGMIAHGLVIGYLVTIVLIPPIYFLPMVLSAIPMLIWYILIGRTLFQLAGILERSESTTQYLKEILFYCAIFVLSALFIFFVL